MTAQTIPKQKIRREELEEEKNMLEIRKHFSATKQGYV